MNGLNVTLLISYGLMIDSHDDQLQVGPIAQRVDLCICVAEVRVQMVSGLNFST